MNASRRLAWGEMLLTFRQRSGYRQGELADALSYIRLPLELSPSHSPFGDNITIQNYEISRFEQGHRCPRARARHLELMYGLVQLGSILSQAEADEWLGLADQRPLNQEERNWIFGQQRGQIGKPVAGPQHLELEIDSHQLQFFERTHRTNYLNRILHQCEYLPLQGMALDTRSTKLAAQQRIGLLDVYIELDTTAKTEVLTSAQPGKNRLQPLGVLPALIRSTRMVLIGAPGGGKSTFLNYLAYCLANHHLHPTDGWLQRHLPHWPVDWERLLPIAITLRDVATWIENEQITQRNSRLLLDYLQSWLHERILDEYYFVIKDHLRRGQALLLLDGLDELPDNERLRRQIKEMIADLPAAFPDTPMLVTCRVLSYRMTDWQLEEREWPPFELAELTETQIRHFIRDWYQLMHSLQLVQSVDTLSERLVQAVFRPDLLRLARNPLLLTVMALVHTHKGQLPDARALLFEAVVELLLWRWEAIKLKNPDGSETTWHQLLATAYLNETMMKQRLWRLAFHIHGRSQLIVGDDSAAEITAEITLSELLATLRELHPERSLAWAERLVQIIQLRAGLLVEKRPNLFGFPHRTFQEYLAACHLATQPNFVEQALMLVDRRQSWYEVILLAIGYQVHCCALLDSPLQLLDRLCPTAAPPLPSDTTPLLSNVESGWLKIWLAAKALLEIGAERATMLVQGRVLIERLRHHLTTLITHDLLEPRLRAEAATILSSLGDGRLLTTLVTIPAGRFRMGNTVAQLAQVTGHGVPALVKRSIAEADARSYLEAAAPQHECHLAQYQISRYLITNEQYAHFVSATGHSAPDHWRGPTPPPELRNHPVVNVSWHDAKAYCRWRTAEQGTTYRLPTEAEWEKAAIGEQGTLFPWGDELGILLHNNYQAGIGTTSSVGIFQAGASPYGCYDMAGNVYEWTSSLWGADPWSPSFRYPYQPNDGREDPTAPDTVYRVLRGGAYYLSNIFTSCTYRDRDLPTNKGRSLGFRVVRE